MEPNVEPVRPSRPRAPSWREEAASSEPSPKAPRTTVIPGPGATDVALLLATAVLLGAGALLENAPEHSTVLLVVSGLALSVVLLARLAHGARG